MMTEVQRLHEDFLAPDPAARPMMRWWWFGPDVARADLLRDLDDMAAAGIGGVECSFVYPMGAESDSFGSPSFLDDVRFAAVAAVDRGLRFDITLGSGWPYGGPHIDETTASRRLHWEREEVLMAAQRLPMPQTWPSDEFVAGYIGEGTRWEAPTSYVQLETQDGELIIPPGRGPRVILLAISRLSGQTLKRASKGAEGWVLDHMNPAAAESHIAAVAEPLVAAAGIERIGTVFCDSLEVFNADFSAAVPAEFAARRGYDPLPVLWQLTLTDGTGAAFQADYHRTLTELVETNFIQVIGDWARAKGLAFRLQCYGQPPVTISSYRHADAFEGEGWGWDAITACRWASSAGQLYGNDVISSETWTWNHSPSFRSTPLDLLGEAHDHLLMGINQFIGHGWPTSPHPQPETPGATAELGRVFYASAALDSRNAWWGAAPELWTTLHRLSWLMRQGRRLSQVGIYLPARDISAGFAAAGRVDLYKESRLHIGDELPRAIRTAGLDFDLFDDDALALLDPATFPLVVLPWARDLPESTRAWLRRVEQIGGVVLDLGGTAGLAAQDLSKRGLDAEDLGATGLGTVVTDPAVVPDLLPISAEVPVRIHTGGVGGTDQPISPPSSPPSSPSSNEAGNQTVAVTTRIVGGVRIHFIANTGPHTAQVGLQLRARGIGLDQAGGSVPEPEQKDREQDERAQVLERWDPTTGEVSEVRRIQGVNRVTLEAYESAVLIEHGDLTRLAAAPDAEDQAIDAPGQTLSIDDWLVRFDDQSQSHPIDLPHQWEQDPARRLYSGTATYSAELKIPSSVRRITLDLGPALPHELEDPEGAGLMEASFSAKVLPPVGAVAKVILDGVDHGFLWKTPYRLELTDWVTPGQNHQLQLVVSNVTSHRLAADVGLPRLVAEADASFGTRFGIQTLDLALADVASGLLAKPALRIT